MKQTLMKVIVGSHAHGLADSNSDIDYRAVFAVPTVDILSLGNVTETTSMIDDKIDDVSHEVGKFLSLCVKSNPNALEILGAPVVASTTYTDALKSLLPHVWSSRGVFDAFRGYSKSQEKRLMDLKEERRWKFAAAKVRTLIQAWHLLKTGDLMVEVYDEFKPVLKKIRAGEYTVGEVLDIAEVWENHLERAYTYNPNKQTDYSKINSFLLDIRKELWSEDQLSRLVVADKTPDDLSLILTTHP